MDDLRIGVRVAGWAKGASARSLLSVDLVAECLFALTVDVGKEGMLSARRHGLPTQNNKYSRGRGFLFSIYLYEYVIHSVVIVAIVVATVASSLLALYDNINEPICTIGGRFKHAD